MSRVTCALGPDSAGTLVHRFIRSATERLDVAVYEMGPSYAWLMPEAARRGVRTRLLLDGHAGANTGCLEELSRAAAKGTIVPCRLVRHRLGAEAHWKLLVADADRVAVGTGNLIKRDAPADRGGLLPPAAAAVAGTREWWVFVDGVPTLAERGRRAIAAAFAGAAPAPRLWEVAEPEAAPPVGAPQPAVPPLEIELASRRLQLVTGARAVHDMIESTMGAAAGRLLVTLPYIHTWAPPVRPLLDRLAELSGHADVRLLLGGEPSDGDAARLRERGIVARVMNAGRCTTGHAKGIVGDGVALVTSANWSAAGLGSSLEAGLRLDSAAAAAYYADAFERDWLSADPLQGG